jgi:predicted nucleic acid-binding protein
MISRDLLEPANTVFIDSNVPMYLIGAPHPHKETVRRMLESAIARGDRMVTDAQVFQEILHRYYAIRRPDAIQAAFDALHGVVDEVFAVELADVEQAKGLMLTVTGLSARDAVHAAVMRRRGVTRLMSLDAGFDRVAGIERIS